MTPTPWRTVGDVGEPAFQNGWEAEARPVRFRIEGDVLRLAGDMHGPAKAGGSVAFTLPAGYRPAVRQSVAVLSTPEPLGENYANVELDGTVNVGQVRYVSLDGVTIPLT